MSKVYEEEEKRKYLDAFNVSGKLKLPLQEKIIYQKQHLELG